MRSARSAVVRDAHRHACPSPVSAATTRRGGRSALGSAKASAAATLFFSLVIGAVFTTAGATAHPRVTPISRVSSNGHSSDLLLHS